MTFYTDRALAYAASAPYAAFTLPKGAEVEYVADLGPMTGGGFVIPAAALAALTGNTHDPAYRYTRVPAVCVLADDDAAVPDDGAAFPYAAADASSRALESLPYVPLWTVPVYRGETFANVVVRGATEDEAAESALSDEAINGADWQVSDGNYIRRDDCSAGEPSPADPPCAAQDPAPDPIPAGDPWAAIAAALDSLGSYIDIRAEDQNTGESEGVYEEEEGADIWEEIEADRAQLAQARKVLADLSATQPVEEPDRQAAPPPAEPAQPAPALTGWVVESMALAVDDIEPAGDGPNVFTVRRNVDAHWMEDTRVRADTLAEAVAWAAENEAACTWGAGDVCTYDDRSHVGIDDDGDEVEDSRIGG